MGNQARGSWTRGGSVCSVFEVLGFGGMEALLDFSRSLTALHLTNHRPRIARGTDDPWAKAFQMFDGGVYEEHSP